MKAVILAAGEGTRMRPLTQNRPKVMLPVGNKPILEHIMLAVRDVGITDFVFVVGYRSETIMNHFGDGSKWNIHIDYVEQKEQLGTANAVGVAKEFVNDRFLALNGDVLVRSMDLQNLMKEKKDVVLAVKEVDNPQEFGVIEVRGDRVTRVVEKSKNPPSNLANAGIYVLGPEIFDAIDKTLLSSRGEHEITDSLQILIDDGYAVGYQVIDYWFDIGRPWDLLDANELLLKDIETDIQGIIEPYATIKEPIIVAKSTIIRNGAYIIGPITIGENCDIGPNCLIRPSTSLGDDVRIGNAVEIKNSIIMGGTNIGHLSYVGDSIIGTNCNLGAGTKVANLRLNEKNIKVMVK
ncbi:MAG: NTP transferase domain-containing protein, partial [Euryarchaeota archaeon]|nr:NTP transferase domain-containing protein [Euryarchaeota archaeon]